MNQGNGSDCDDVDECQEQGGQHGHHCPTENARCKDKVLHYVLKISLFIYLQCQFVPNKLKFSRSGIWMVPRRSPWSWGKDTRIKCSYSIFLVFAIFVFLPSNNFGATNRAWHGLGLMRQKCGCIYQGIILKYLFAKTKCWKYFRSPSNHTKAADTFNFNSTFIALLLTSGSSK